MRIITGTARGTRIITVPGNELVRPTPERVKEGIFSSIQFGIEGRRILDLFAGCGQLGIEALSRGASSATFVDASDVSLKTVKTNLENARLFDKAKTVRSDFATFTARCTDTFDIAFLDPPYYSGILEKAVTAVAPIMSSAGIIVCEHPSDVSLSPIICGFSLSKTLKYGKIIVSVYRKEGDAD